MTPRFLSRALALTAALAFLLLPSAAPATTPADPGPVTGGTYCADNARGDQRPGTQGNWYICGQDPKGDWRWLPIGRPDTPPACGGYGKPCTPCVRFTHPKPCTSPSTSSSPKPSTSPSTSSSPKPSHTHHASPSASTGTPVELPVTSSTNGKLVAGSVTAGILLILAGTAFLLWRPTRQRKAQHRPGPRTTA